MTSRVMAAVMTTIHGEEAHGRDPNVTAPREESLHPAKRSDDLARAGDMAIPHVRDRNVTVPLPSSRQHCNRAATADVRESRSQRAAAIRM